MEDSQFGLIGLWANKCLVEQLCKHFNFFLVLISQQLLLFPQEQNDVSGWLDVANHGIWRHYFLPLFIQLLFYFFNIQVFHPFGLYQPVEFFVSFLLKIFEAFDLLFLLVFFWWNALFLLIYFDDCLELFILFEQLTVPLLSLLSCLGYSYELLWQWVPLWLSGQSLDHINQLVVVLLFNQFDSSETVLRICTLDNNFIRFLSCFPLSNLPPRQKGSDTLLKSYNRVEFSNLFGDIRYCYACLCWLRQLFDGLIDNFGFLRFLNFVVEGRILFMLSFCCLAVFELGNWLLSISRGQMLDLFVWQLLFIPVCDAFTIKCVDVALSNLHFVFSLFAFFAALSIRFRLRWLCRCLW